MNAGIYMMTTVNLLLRIKGYSYLSDGKLANTSWMLLLQWRVAKAVKMRNQKAVIPSKADSLRPVLYTFPQLDFMRIRN